jgi:hypothetical protein
MKNPRKFYRNPAHGMCMFFGLLLPTNQIKMRLTICPFATHDWRLFWPPHNLIVGSTFASATGPWPSSDPWLLCNFTLTFFGLDFWKQFILFFLKFFLETHPQFLVHELELLVLLLGLSLVRLA